MKKYLILLLLGLGLEGKVRNSPLALSIIRFLYHYKYGNKYNQYID